MIRGGLRGWLVLALLGAVAVAGCGTSHLSTRALRARATRICGLATRGQARVAAPTNTASGTRFLTRGATTVQTELRALRRLEPGGPAAPVYRRALAALDGELHRLQTGAAALARGADPVSEIRLLQSQLAALETRADAAWKSLEIPACRTH